MNPFLHGSLYGLIVCAVIAVLVALSLLLNRLGSITKDKLGKEDDILWVAAAIGLGVGAYGVTLVAALLMESDLPARITAALGSAALVFSLFLWLVSIHEKKRSYAVMKKI